MLGFIPLSIDKQKKNCDLTLGEKLGFFSLLAPVQLGLRRGWASQKSLRNLLRPKSPLQGPLSTFQRGAQAGNEDGKINYFPKLF